MHLWPVHGGKWPAVAEYRHRRLYYTPIGEKKLDKLLRYWERVVRGVELQASILLNDLFSVPASLRNFTVIQRGFFRAFPLVTMAAPFDLQGHRGARGLKPENTLPAFETAIDLGVSTIETDLHLTRDGFVVIFHDDVVSEQLCRPLGGPSAVDLTSRPALSSLTLAQLRRCRADRNPDPKRFPNQDPGITPLATLFGNLQVFDPYAPPTLADLFAFADSYASDLGAKAGKTEQQRQQARRVRFDLELKRVPFDPSIINDDFDGSSPGPLEQKVVEIVRGAGVLGRTTVRSFDHRSVRIMRQLEPGLSGAVLVAGTAPVDPAGLARQADALTYCPDFKFLDLPQVQLLHAAGIRVVPWTVNNPADWDRLLHWGVDGMTTDFPDRLAAVLRRRGLIFANAGENGE